MNAAPTHVLVVAKEPLPGRVKTRLCPPFTPEQAARLAAAALADTLAAAVATSATRVILALDGNPGPWCPRGVEIIEQGHGTLGERLARAWSRAGGPGVQIGMDTPQVTTAMLDAALGHLDDAVLSPALDGGWWLIGFRSPHPDAFAGVPMSSPHTYEHQLARLRSLGLAVRRGETLRDIDDAHDAVAVAAAAPDTRFARELTALMAERVWGSSCAVAGRSDDG
ncbi:MAG: DUF2064 domain-containing protein [Microthrixaceae bacterium]|nr:DUF2064 domain-containing protein [Microthrixaceae bacterium]